jgi:hypothetical protein
MSEWKPIETAPKDRVHLVYQPAFKHRPGQQYELAARICLSTDAGSVRNSTHWMPLPLPPESNT